MAANVVFPAGEAITALPEIPELDLWGQFEAGKERGKGRKERVERDGRKHPEVNIWLRRC